MGPRSSSQPAGHRNGPCAAPTWAESSPREAGRRWPSIEIDGRARISAEQNPPAAGPCKPYPILSLPCFSHAGGGGGAPAPACPPATARSSATQHTATTCFSFLCFLSFPSPSLAPQKRDPQRMHRSWRPEKGGGAAAGPLAGECVPHKGERAAAEGICGGAILRPWVGG
jgi:hypothetical protein